MGLFDFGKSKKQDKPPVMHKRYYAGASKNRLLADFFESERSADSELRPVIKVLRGRSRELVRNNEYAKRYMNLMKTNVVGDRGFTLQVKALGGDGNLDQIGNDSVESAFRKWGRRGNCTVDGKLSWLDAQKLVIEGLVRDGEVFIIKHRANDLHDSFSLQFIEPDQIDEQKNERLKNGNEVRMGIELDRFKRPVAYYKLNYHPGDFDYTSSVSKSKHTRIPADQIIHIFMPLRAEQTRGEPWMSPVMPSLKQLGGFREAAVINARIGASKMGFITTPSGDGYIPDDMEGNTPIMEIEPGTVQQLAAGQDFTTFDPTYPNNEFDSFHKSVLKGIASGLGISYTSLSNDLEATSYSSIRQGALEERDFYRDIQQFVIDHFIREVYESWLGSAMEVNSFGIPLRQYERFADSASFRAKAWSWVDPLKEMNAAVTGMKAGVMSIQDVAAQYGKDVEELFAQIQRDKALAEQFGVKYALEPYGADKINVMPDAVEEDDAEVQGQGD
jgi:lambda family phage portal protein